MIGFAEISLFQKLIINTSYVFIQLRFDNLNYEFKKDFK